MRQKMKFAFAVTAAILACAAASVHAQAPGEVIAMSGSSALYEELGQASSIISLQTGATDCVWDSGGTKDFTLTDTRPGLAGIGANTTDTGTAWIFWTSGVSGTCESPTAGFDIIVFVSVDSTVGNRCFFASPSCTLTLATALAATGAPYAPISPTALPGISESDLPATVINGITNSLGTGLGAAINAAATDIRPEDAAFATLRALTPCGQNIQDTITLTVGGAETLETVYTQYEGIGDQTTSYDQVGGKTVAGAAIDEGNGGTKVFNVLAFNLFGKDPIVTTNNVVSSYTVTQVGAVPVVVFVNPANISGFGSLSLSNIDRGILAGYLDGTYGSTSDAFLVQSPSAPPSGSTVFIREYLSGTYNTMEYGIPNNREIQSGQDVGLAAQQANANGVSFPPYNCSGGTVYGGATYGLNLNSKYLNDPPSTINPLYESFTRPSGETSIRTRQIGTGDEIGGVLGTNTGHTLSPTDSLGYAFWSAANFVNATAKTGKYLTVDGVDPIQETWADGLIPTSSNDLLHNVSLSNVSNGSYPIWSILRLVSSSAGATTAMSDLQAAAIKFLGPTQPDFVHSSQLPIVRSHFAPPQIAFTGPNGNCTPVLGTSNCASNASNGSSGSGESAEAGGDVGGIVLTLQSELDYFTDTGLNGNLGKRQ
jgi:hypothetical protein